MNYYINYMHLHGLLDELDATRWIIQVDFYCIVKWSQEIECEIED